MSFWQDKRVLITGHTGFKGSWLSLWLHTLGAKVHGFSLPAEPLSLFNIAGFENDVESIFGDISEPGKVHQAIDLFQPEIIFHLAAQPLVRLSYYDPIMTFNTNVMGTVHLLESIKTCASVRSIVVVTSDKCYENKEWLWPYRENDRLGGNDPYSASKACTELVVNSYRHSFFKQSQVQIATTRAGNVIGGGDWGKDRLLPDLFKGYENKQTVIIRNPEATRPWQHVCEPLNGYLMLAKNLFAEPQGKFNQAWNFGPEDTANKTVRWIADQLQDQLHTSNLWQTDSAENPHEAQLLKLDNSKAKSKLGWQPQLSVHTALQWTAEWHRAWWGKQEMKQFTLAQITDYLAILGKQK